MKTEWHRIFFGRVARNVFFWLLFCLFEVVGPLLAETPTLQSVLFHVKYTLLQTVLLCLVVYANNLFFIPRLFEKKKYGLYFLVVTGWIIVMAEITEIFFDYFIQNYPQYLATDVPFNYFIAVILVSIFLFGFTLAKFANDYFVREDAVKLMEKKQVESELNFLKSQINPHFLFNTLNSIYSLALKKSDQTAEVVLKLSDLLRYILYECNAERIALSKEIETLNNYIELERIRTKSNARITFTILGDPGHIQVAPLIWITFVENAFKHGMGSRASDGFVNIEMDIKPDLLIFKCMNNFGEAKISYTPNATQVGGIGMENIKKRLALIYPDRHKLKIEINEGIFFVELILKPDTQ